MTSTAQKLFWAESKQRPSSGSLQFPFFGVAISHCAGLLKVWEGISLILYDFQSSIEY